MITGAHAIIYSKDAEADRAFLKDVLRFAHVDAGDGWLIFRLPPAEVAVHPSDANDEHELYLLTDDVEALAASMEARGLEATPRSEQGWGRLMHVTLPGGGKLGIYEPRHASPPAHRARAASGKKRKRTTAKASARAPRRRAKSRR
jgi:hypothetical protein